MKRSLTPVLTATAALVATLAGAATLLALGGYSPGAVFAALFRGAFGTWDRFFSFTLVRATLLPAQSPFLVLPTTLAAAAVAGALWAAVVTAIVFGALSAGGGAMQRDAGVPEVWVRGIEALVILAVLTVDRSWQVLAGRGSRD